MNFGHFPVCQINSDNIHQISDIFQQNISDKVQGSQFPVTESNKMHSGHIQALNFGLIQHAQINWVNVILGTIQMGKCPSQLGKSQLGKKSIG